MLSRMQLSYNKFLQYKEQNYIIQNVKFIQELLLCYTSLNFFILNQKAS